MNASFRALSLESGIPQQSSTVSRSKNACHAYSQGIITQESPQGFLLHHMSPDQGDQHAQEPQGRQPASSVSSRSSTPTRFFYDSLEQLPSSADQRPREAGNVQGLGKRNISSWLFTNWTMDILSCTIACLCLAAIFGILYTHQGLPLPQLPLNITINALIAVFTAIFKVTLMVPVAGGISQFKWLWFDQPRELADIERLDQASRGAWGSFLLLVSRAPRLDAIWLANLGAIITIAALAVDPFSQQIIQSEPCLQNITGAVAEIPKLQHFETGMVVTAEAPPLSGSLQAAIYMGLLSPPPNSSAAMTANCRTGNCTFPSDNGETFSTLAMCHSCVDISHTITYYNTDGMAQAAIQSGANISSYLTPFAATASSPLFNDSLFSFEALMSWELDDFAVACGMTPCLKTFGANVTNGFYQERELSSVDLIWSDVAGYTLATNMTLRNGTWQFCMPTTQNTTANTLRINITTMGLMSYVKGNVEYPLSSKSDLENTSPGASLWYPDDCVSWFESFPAEQMKSFLRRFFDNKTLNTPLLASGSSFGQGDLWLVNLYRNRTATMGTVGAFMDGLTWSVTATMRQTSTSEDAPRALRAASGQTQVVQSCLTVRWVWLGLPASLLGLQLAFLIAIVVTCRSAEPWRGDWKDSSLALLYHGLEGSANIPDEKVEYGELRDKDGMFKMARVTKVQLRQGKDNWRFHKVP
ncbi:hypothetical protein FJTKL_02260 [Diaporthe vaccinii]|uniref:Carboxylic ester hydrolase n=2 Tax=Diaporthe vaccinii TaxID=105482 RepID=A0ABR4F3Z9_9PEZI